MRVPRFFLVLAMGYFSPAMGQQNTTKDDFAFGHEISFSDAKSSVDVPLPEAIYQTVKNANLSDAAVFNGNDEVVPHEFVKRQRKAVAQEIRPVRLTLFPVYGHRGDANIFDRLRVTKTKDGNVVIEQSAGKSRAEKILSGYLIDVSKITGEIKKLQFSDKSFESNKFVKISVEGSDDLRQWTPVASDEVLGKFEFENESLVKDEVNLNSRRFSYYRIGWQNGGDGVKLGEGRAILDQGQTMEAKEVLNWREASPSQIETANQPTTYQYDLGGYYPVTAVRIQFADQNSAASLKFECSQSESGPWSDVSREKFYTFAKDGANLAKLETSFVEQSSRFWRIQLLSSAAGIGRSFPEVSFGWRPQTLRFLARGKPPFVLAYGSSATTMNQQRELFETAANQDAAIGTLKGKVSLGGAERLVVVKKSDTPWKKFALWGVLLFGVGLLGVMALQVRKQLPPG